MRAVFLFTALLMLAGCARERFGLVMQTVKGVPARVAGAEVFVIKQEAEEALLAPARAAAAAKKKEVDEAFLPQIARLEASLSRVIGTAALGSTPVDGPVGGDKKRNTAMEALMAKQKEAFLARAVVRDTGFDALRKALTQPPVTTTKDDGAFTVKLSSNDVVLVLDAKTKTAWRVPADAFAGLTTFDEGRMMVFP
jgi:hypothetical protein